MQSLSVLVVDDHSIVRQGICGILSDEPTLEIVDEVASGEEAVTRAQSLRPDVVLLDISLPGISGIAAARLIRKVSSQSRIIFLSQHDSPQMVREAFNSGETDTSRRLTQYQSFLRLSMPFVKATDSSVSGYDLKTAWKSPSRPIGQGRPDLPGTLQTSESAGSGRSPERTALRTHWPFCARWESTTKHFYSHSSKEALVSKSSNRTETNRISVTNVTF